MTRTRGFPGLVAWIAGVSVSVSMGTSARPGGILNVVVGIVGPLIGGWLPGPLPDLDANSAGRFSDRRRKADTSPDS